MASNSRGAARPQHRPQSAPKRPAVQQPAVRSALGVHGKWKSKLKLLSVRSGMDLTFFFLVLLLVVIGLVMVFSASYANSSYRFGTPYLFVKNQAEYAVLGLILMIGISYFDYHHLHKLALPIYVVTVILLGITVVFRGSALVTPTNGAYRWITIGSFQFQPSEIAKFALILVFAHLLAANADTKLNDAKSRRFRLLTYAGAIGIICGLVIAEKHLSATIILVLLAAIMLFVGGLPTRWFVIGGGVVVAILVAVSSLPFYQHVSTRMTIWKNPWDPSLSSDEAWQTQQSLYAIGSGRLLGLGLGKSRQKYMYLPEPQNDFIFSIVCEELGFIGALLIIILFGVLIWRGVMISLRAKDKFGMLLGIGLIMQVGIQVVLNIAVVTNTIPNTGVSLPFFSYGGTSLVMLLAEMGLILSISRTSSIEKT